MFARVSVGVIVRDFRIKSFLITVASEFNIKRRIGERRGREEAEKQVLHGDKDWVVHLQVTNRDVGWTFPLTFLPPEL